MTKLTWFVTGASSGFGESLVQAILDAGDNVIATARPRRANGADRLSSLKEAGAAVMELDTTAPAEVLAQKAADAIAVFGQVDVLVNNAGAIEAGVFEEYNEEFITASLRNNALGPLNLTRAFLPHMRSRGTGTILFMSTFGVYFGAPGASTYLASKGLLEALVPCLGIEVQPFGIRTCLVQPGYFRTKVFTPGNIEYRAPKKLPEYAEVNKLVEGGCNAMDGKQEGDPRKGADIIVEAVRGEGRCAGKELPERLPLGADAVQAIRESSNAKIKLADEWADIVSSTGC